MERASSIRRPFPSAGVPVDDFIIALIGQTRPKEGFGAHRLGRRDQRMNVRGGLSMVYANVGAVEREINEQLNVQKRGKDNKQKMVARGCGGKRVSYRRVAPIRIKLSYLN